MGEEQRGLLQAVLDNPQDDVVRLIYADYLQEVSSLASDRARGEFIRLQVLEEDIPRQDAILLTYRKRWRNDLWPLSLNNSDASLYYNVQTIYTRGFISHISLKHDDFLMDDLAGVLFSNEPIERVKLVDKITLVSMSRFTYVKIDNKVQSIFNYHIDNRLYELFPIETRTTYEGTEYQVKGEFNSSVEAQIALSNACVSYGRSEAERWINRKLVGGVK